MKPPSDKSGGRGGSGKTPFRPGGPRPATPRPASPRLATPRPDAARGGSPKLAGQGQAREADRAQAKAARSSERPVLTAVARPTPSGPKEPGARGSRIFTPRPRAASPRPPQQAPEIEAPRGTVWLYGIHAIGAAMTNPARRLRRLLLTEEAEAAMAAQFPKPWPLSVEKVDRPRLDQLLGREMVHQGAALLADPLGSPSLAQALERPGPVIVLDQVSDPRNVGAILRSAAMFGAACVITQDRNAPDESGALAKAASGALERVPLLRAVNIARTLVALKAAGCWVVGMDIAGSALSGPGLAQRRVALVLGSEGEGMRRLTRETCDELAVIPMPGGGSGMDSLNVSAAATVALYELTRRH